MASAITEDTGNIGNQNNFCKYVLLIMEPCSEAFFYVYKWLYSWNSSNPEDLEDHLDKTPSYDTKNKKLKNYLYLNQYEKDRIRAMKGNVNVLKGVDISLLYKVSTSVFIPMFSIISMLLEFYFMSKSRILKIS